MNICTECSTIGGYHQRWCPEHAENKRVTPIEDTEPSMAAINRGRAEEARIFREMPDKVYKLLQDGLITTDEALAVGREELAAGGLTFTLTITLGNDGMQTPDDVARALASVSRFIGGDEAEWPEFGPSTVRDLNGNTVGSWDVK